MVTFLPFGVGQKCRSIIAYSHSLERVSGASRRAEFVAGNASPPIPRLATRKSAARTIVISDMLSGVYMRRAKRCDRSALARAFAGVVARGQHDRRALRALSPGAVPASGPQPVRRIAARRSAAAQ